MAVMADGAFSLQPFHLNGICRRILQKAEDVPVSANGQGGQLSPPALSAVLLPLARRLVSTLIPKCRLPACDLRSFAL